MIPTTAPLSVRPAGGPRDWEAATSLLHDYASWIRAATSFDPLVEQPSFADELGDLARHQLTPTARGMGIADILLANAKTALRRSTSPAWSSCDANAPPVTFGRCAA